MARSGWMGWVKRPMSRVSNGAGGALARPGIEMLEDRTVPAVLGTTNLPLDVSGLQVVGEGTEQQIQGIVNFAGQEAGIITFDLDTSDPVGTDECPILNLEIQPISLNLLGLNVDTSAICLDVTATDDTGLLGGLLCDLSGGGLDLGGILDELDAVVGRVDAFLDQIEGLLDNILGQSFNVDAVFSDGGMAASHAEDGNCDILNLSLGPVNLDVPLLGVSVDLDNCEDGPVTVDVTGDPDGGLLGGVLCGLADGLGGLNPTRLINRVERLIDRLGDIAEQLGRIDDLGGRFNHQVEQLTRQLIRAAERVDSFADLSQFFDQLDRTIDRLDRLADRLTR